MIDRLKRDREPAPRPSPENPVTDAVFSTYPLPMWIFDRRSFEFLDVNEAATAEYGYSREEFLSMTVMDIRPAEDRSKLREHVDTPVREFVESGVWRHQRKDGAPITVAIRAHSMPFLDREAVLVTADRIADFGEGEPFAGLMETALLRAFFFTPLPQVIVGAADGRIRETNAPYCRLTGFARAELLDRTTVELAIAPDAPSRAGMVDALLQTDAATGNELQIRTKEGEIRYVLVTGAPIVYAGEQCVLSSLLDMTERRRAGEETAAAYAQAVAAQAELEAANRRLSFHLEAGTLLEESIDYHDRLRKLAQIAVPTIADWCFVDVLDAQGKRSRLAAVHSDPLKVKLAYEIQRRYPGEQTSFTRSKEVLSSGKPIVLEEIPDEMLAAEARDQEHLLLMRQLGLRSCVLVPLVAHHQTVGIVGLIMAESGRRYDKQDLQLVLDLVRRASLYVENARMYADLDRLVRERTAQLEETNRDLESFSYSVSHDLRAPLRHVAGFVQLLEQRIRATLDDKASHYLDNIADATTRMGALIDDLLAFSRIGRGSFHVQRVETRTLAANAISDFQGETSDRAIEWVLGDLPTVLADPALLQLVFQNLVGNAVKFTATRTPARIEIACMREDTEYRFWVRDNGVGFDMAYSDKLFGVFQRLHSRTEFDGTGIGLANVRRVISRHGGRTWAEGAVDQGATIYFTLPRTDEV